MDMYLRIAQKLDCNYETCKAWIINREYIFGNYYLLFREHPTSTINISRWQVVFRAKGRPIHSLSKSNFPGQGFIFDDPLSIDDYIVPINDFNEVLEIKSLLGDDIKIGFVEITLITEDATRLLLYLDDGIDKRFLSPFFSDLSIFIAPPRKITKSIDPEIEEQLLESLPDLQGIDLLDEENDIEDEEGVYRFSNPAIKQYEFKGKKPNDDLLLDMWIKGVPVSQIASKLSYASETIRNRSVILRKILGVNVVPYRNPKKKLISVIFATIL
jgi:hypothetical protein